MLNQDGVAYQPYGAGGLPFTMSGIAGIFGIMPSSGADPQDWKYLTDSAPGSFSRKMYNQRTCNPLWNTQGCKTIPTGGAGVTTAPDPTANAGSQAWYNKFFGFFNSDTENISARVEPTTSYRGLIIPGLAAAALGYIYFGGSEDDQG